MIFFLLFCGVVLVHARLSKVAQMELMYTVACVEADQAIAAQLVEECEALRARVSLAKEYMREYDSEEEL